MTDLSKTMQRHARAVLDEHGVTMFRAQVAGFDVAGHPILTRLTNLDDNGALVADTSPAIRLDGTRSISGGDWVWCLRSGGHDFVIGPAIQNGFDATFIENIVSDTTTKSLSQSSINGAVNWSVTKALKLYYNRAAKRVWLEGTIQATVAKTGGALVCSFPTFYAPDIIQRITVPQYVNADTTWNSNREVSIDELGEVRLLANMAVNNRLSLDPLDWYVNFA